ncbi:MAG: carboxypeptidase regulatory-like domain-containing protein [Cyclobacteriaceae bacterium]|nr:carboxypeptidase regulatory-like domain-containing protein [Cyclobacteriaceae bacterium]
MNKFQFIILILSIPMMSVAQSKSQGICGEVRWLEGNQMPGPGVKTNSGKPVVREIYIYNAVKPEQTIVGESPAFIVKVNAKLVKRIKTRKDGTFHVDLQPGKYSMLTMEPGGLWAGTYDGEGYINPVTVESGQYTAIHIMINYKAYY